MFRDELVDINNDVDKGKEWREKRNQEYETMATDTIKEMVETTNSISLNLRNAVKRNFLIGENQNISYIENIKNALRDIASVSCICWFFEHNTDFLPKDKIDENRYDSFTVSPNIFCNLTSRIPVAKPAKNPIKVTKNKLDLPLRNSLIIFFAMTIKAMKNNHR